MLKLLIQLSPEQLKELMRDPEIEVSLDAKGKRIPLYRRLNQEEVLDMVRNALDNVDFICGTDEEVAGLLPPEIRDLRGNRFRTIMHKLGFWRQPDRTWRKES